MSNEFSLALETYGGVHTFRPKRIIYCHSIEDVCSAVARAVSEGLRVRVMGNGYSWATHVLTADVCLRLIGLNRIIAVDRSKKTVRVEAGVRLGDLTRSLSVHGMTLPSLSFLSDATVGGVIATATHGTSSKWGTLSDFVVSMTLVLSTGEIKTIGVDDSPEELRAAKVAVGMLGVIVEVELQIIDMPWVRYSEQIMNMSEFLSKRKEILSRYEHVWVHWTLGIDKLLVKRFESREKPTRGFHHYISGDNAPWENRNIIAKLSRKIKRILPGVVASATSSVRNSEERLSKADRRQVWMSMQYGVPASQAETAIDLVRTSEFAKAHAGRVVEFKFLKATDGAYLGPNVGEDAFLINIWWLVDEYLKFTIFSDFENMMKTLNAKPHWGKLHTSPDLVYMKRAYPQWVEFEAVRARFDPSRTFSIFEPKQDLRPVVEVAP